MEYRRFGRTELSLSVLSLGTMRLIDPLQDPLHDDTRESAALVLAAARAAGINHLETAQAYGQSEYLLGHVLQNRSEWVITTKLLPTLPADTLARSLDQSLTALNIDYLDQFAFHGINTPEHLEAVLTVGLPVLRRSQAAGLVHHVGFSTHGNLALVQRAIATDEFDFVNLHYHFSQQHLAAAVAQAAAHDMGVFIISPGDKGGQLYTPPPQLESLCAPLSPLSYAYSFLLANPAIHTLSVGPASVSELETCLSALAQHQPSQIAAISETLRQQLEAIPDYCGQCQACLPCPEAIAIPEILRLRNLSEAYDMQAFGQYRYAMLEQAGHWFPGRRGDRCSDCGDCLPRCPLQLDIPTLLRQTHAKLMTPSRRRLWET